MFTSAHASSYEECSWWKDGKASKRRSCIRDNLTSDQNQAKSPWSMGLKLQTHYSLSCTVTKTELVNLVQLYPTLCSNFWCIWRSYFLVDKAQQNLMSRLEPTQKLIRHSSLMNPDEDHHEHQHSDEEHSNILMFILGTQQHSDDQNVHPDFQVKACGAQDTWHNTIGHPTTAIWAQRLYK